MDIYFSWEKTSFSYDVLLSKISFKYCNNLDGRIYANIIRGNQSSIEVVKELINALNPIFLTKKNVIILNLLVNPFFDELCQAIKENTNISSLRKLIIKKNIFEYLGSAECKLTFLDEKVEGHNIYNSKNMYEISNVLKEIL